MSSTPAVACNVRQSPATRGVFEQPQSAITNKRHGQRAFTSGTCIAFTVRTPKSPEFSHPETVMTKYELPPLPYDYAALEPHISAKIMELHHDKHHKTYVDGA